MPTLPEAARRAGRNPETKIRGGRLRSRKIHTVPLPAWMKRTATGEPMPDVVAVLRRQRTAH